MFDYDHQRRWIKTNSLFVAKMRKWNSYGSGHEPFFVLKFTNPYTPKGFIFLVFTWLKILYFSSNVNRKCIFFQIVSKRTFFCLFSPLNSAFQSFLILTFRTTCWIVRFDVLTFVFQRVVPLLQKSVLVSSICFCWLSGCWECGSWVSGHLLPVPISASWRCSLCEVP